ncbi:hypothetical protein ACROYT_G042896 [Oculina patagonica]
MSANLRRQTWFNVLIIIVAGNLIEGAVQNVENTFNLSCIPSEIKGVFREVWHDHKIQANNLSSLTEHPDFPENPRSTKTTNSFETSIDHPRYGQRHRAYIAVPESGLYKFHVSCDSACALLIEAQHDSTFMRCLNITRGINMTSGRFYHMTVLHVGEESSQDLQVSFTTPNGTTETPIPNDYLIAYKADGILGEFTPGNWGAWGECHLGIQTRQRLCQSVPPVYSGVNPSYKLSDTKRCEACPQGWSLFNKHCYKLNNFTEGKNWSDARETCLNLNSDLVSIKSEDEHNFVFAHLSNETRSIAWIGLQDGSEVWSDGSNVTYVSGKINTRHQSPPITCYTTNLDSMSGVMYWSLIHCSWKLSKAVCKRRAFYGDNGTCLSSPLGVETGLIQEHQMTSGSSYNITTTPRYGRLAGPGAWCEKKTKEPNYLEIDLIVLHYICAIATQGFYEQGYFTKEYMVFLRVGDKGDYYTTKNGTLMHQGNSNPYEVHVTMLEDGVVADKVTFSIPLSSPATSCLRVEIYGRPFDNSTGPTRPPRNIQLVQHPTSLYGIEMSWQVPEVFFLAGELKGYKVIFSHADGTWQWTFGPETTVEPFGPFERNTTFCATVVALNYYGEGVAADCINITTRDGACPISWTRYRNSCYLTESKPGTWTQAKEGCLSRNSQLVTITNYEENNFVAALANNVSWIGAQWNDSISDYLWVDGSDIGFSDKWKNKRRESNLCVGICTSSDLLCSSVGAWHQDKCVHLKPFVCERKVAHETDNETCSNMAVGFEYGILGEYRITASSSWYENVPWKARLAGEEAWCPQTNTSVEYLEVTLESLHSICAVATQGLHATGAYTKTYRLQLSIDGSEWEWYNGGNSEILQGNDNSYEVVKQVFEPYIPKAQYVRIWPVSFCVHPCLRIEIYGEPTTLEATTTMAPSTEFSTTMASSTEFSTTMASSTELSTTMASSTEPSTTLASSTKLSTTMASSTELSTTMASSTEPSTTMASSTEPSTTMASSTELSTTMTSSTELSTTMASSTELSTTMASSTEPSTTMASSTEPSTTMASSTEPSTTMASSTERSTTMASSTELSTTMASSTERSTTMASSTERSTTMASSTERSTTMVPTTPECQKALGMESGSIADSQINASSEYSTLHAAALGRLHLQAAAIDRRGAWSALTNDVNQWLQIDLIGQYRVTRVATQGRSDPPQWVTRYQLQYSNNTLNFQDYKEHGQEATKNFTGNTDRHTVVSHDLKPPITVRYIRFRPVAWNLWISMRVELYGCHECHDALGMESGEISDGQIRASSQHAINYAAYHGRLHFQKNGGIEGAWSALTNDVNQWLQIDMIGRYKVTRVATQGRNGFSQWVTQYQLQYSNDALDFQDYKEHGQNASKNFAGNTDKDTVVSHDLKPPIMARYIRFVPVAWRSYGRMLKCLVKFAFFGAFSLPLSGSDCRLSLAPWVGDRCSVRGGSTDQSCVRSLRRCPLDCGVFRSPRLVWLPPSAPAGRRGRSKFGEADANENFPLKNEQLELLLFPKARGSGNNNNSGNSGNNSVVWTQWSDWSACSKSCDQGLQFRNRTCLSPSECTNGTSQEEKGCNFQECPGSELDPPSNVTTINTTSTSVAIHWTPYSGNNTLLGYRVLVLNQGRRESRKKREISQLEGELIRNFTVGPNLTAVEIENLTAFSKYCIRVSVITEEAGGGRLSNCFYFYTEEESKF